MNRSRWNWKLIAQWAAVGLLSAFSFSIFVAACQWYGGHVLPPTKLLMNTLVLTLMLSALVGVIGALHYFEFLAGRTGRAKPGGKRSEDRIVTIGYDLPEARNGLRKQVLAWTVALPLFSGLVMVGFWKYGDAPWWAALTVAAGFEFLGLCYAIIYRGVCRRYAGCRWIVEPEGVRFESPHHEPVVIKWNEIEKIKHQPLRLRKGNETFSLPCIPGLLKEWSESNRNIQRRIRHRFAFDDVSIKLKAPFKLFREYLFIILPLLIITIGWMVLISLTSYDARLMVVPTFMIIIFVWAYAVIKQICWVKPLDKGKYENSMKAKVDDID